MLIKVCGLNDPENFRAVNELASDLVGLIFFDRSSRNVTDPAVEFLNPTIPRVGVFVNADLEMIDKKAREYGLTYLQLHGNETPEYCAILKGKGYAIIKAFAVDQLFDFSIVDHYASSCELALFDTRGEKRGGNGVRFNWNLLKKYTGDLPFLLSGGIDLQHVEMLLTLNHPGFRGVDINSCFELKPGVKDVSKVREFILNIRSNVYAVN